MKDFLQLLQDAFPALKSHPRVILAAFLFLVVLVAVYSAKDMRSKICKSLHSKLCDKIFATQRWLFVFHPSNAVNDWKYYTSEVTGKGNIGDNIIWTLVSWPSLKPIDRFVM